MPFTSPVLQKTEALIRQLSQTTEMFDYRIPCRNKMECAGDCDISVVDVDESMPTSAAPASAKYLAASAVTKGVCHRSILSPPTQVPAV